MPTNVTGTGTTFNLPNFAGELFTASPTRTPFLSMIGGLSGGMRTENDEFATGQLYLSSPLYIFIVLQRLGLLKIQISFQCAILIPTYGLAHEIFCDTKVLCQFPHFCIAFLYSFFQIFFRQAKFNCSFVCLVFMFFPY